METDWETDGLDEALASLCNALEKRNNERLDFVSLTPEEYQNWNEDFNTPVERSGLLTSDTERQLVDDSQSRESLDAAATSHTKL